MLRAKIASCGCALLLSVALISPVCSDWTFIRGDGNGDGVVNLADPIWNLSYLFSSGPSVCLDAQDTNDDGALNLADPVYGLGHLFSSGPPPPPPFPDCGDDPTPSGLSCQGPLAACGPEPLFRVAATYAVGGAPTSVALGDLDGDGDLDMVTANWSSNDHDASVLLGNGDGSFAAAVTYAAGNGPRSVALGDLDGDGDLDMVTANSDSDDAGVLPGNGDGSFAAAVSYAVGDSPVFVALGDLDGDGDLDLATANTGSYPDHDGTTSVLLGNGDGSFAAAVSHAVGAYPSSLALGDLDGDGDLDLVTANTHSHDASVLLGNGDGSFVAAVSYAVGAWPESVALGDLDGDGDLDLVTANRGSHDAGVLLGNGDGSFSAAVSHAVGDSPVSVALGDLDGDGDLDLVTASAGSYSAGVLLGNGAGSFAQAVSHVVGDGPSSVALGDLDGDGNLDVVTANWGNNIDDVGHTASVLLGNGDGSFAGADSTVVGGIRPSSVALGDLDGDGDLDMVTANHDSGTASVLLNRTVP